MSTLASPLKQAGDTIVEVLVVLAVLGLAIGTSYAIANRSLLGARQAQEHSEALGLVQGQIEDLRVLAPQGDIFNQTTPFCIDNPTAASAIKPLTDPACTQGLYQLSITPSVTPGDDTFTVTAAWDSVDSSGQDNVSIVYRLHDVQN